MPKISPIQAALARIYDSTDPTDPGAPPPRLLTLDRIRSERSAQEGDLRALRRVAQRAEEEAAKVDPDLVPDARRDREAKVREEARQKARPILDRMRERADAAKAQAPLHSRKAVLMRAKFKGDAGADALRYGALSGAPGDAVGAGRVVFG